MKIRLRKPFTYQVSATETATLEKGDHTVDEVLAGKAVRFGGAVILGKKKAPENKVVKVAENKTRVGRKTKRSSSTRSKSKR